MPFGIQGITARMIWPCASIWRDTSSPMPFGIQGITATPCPSPTPPKPPSSLQCLSAFRASLPLASPPQTQPSQGVSNAFRHSGHHCRWRLERALLDLGLKVSNAFRHSGHHCQNMKYTKVVKAGKSSPMPFGIQGITASRRRGGKVPPFGMSPMPFGIQGITAERKDRQRGVGSRDVSNAFRHSGHHCRDHRPP